MATLHYAEVFTLHGVRLKFQSKLPTIEMLSESESVPESVSCNVNEQLGEFDTGVDSLGEHILKISNGLYT